MSWKKLGTKLLLDHPRLKVYEDIIELPDGKQTDYIYFGEVPGGTVIIARREDGKILVQKEYSYPPDQILYQFPGGGTNHTETHDEGALRELAEEGQLTGDLKNLGWFYTDNRRKNEKHHVYLATNLKKISAKRDDEEAFEDFWFSENEIETLIKNNELCVYSALCAWSIYKANR